MSAAHNGDGPATAVRPDLAPAWLAPLVERAAEVVPGWIGQRRLVPPAGGGRPASVLIAFGDGPQGPDLLLVERAATLRDHAGQVAFPGGGAEPGDADPVATALREAEEETGLDPSGVVPLVQLPDLYVPPSGFVVTPVIAHWARPVAVRAVDLGETASVARVPLAQLADPANRFTVIHPAGFQGPAFAASGLLVWGFTGGLLAALLDLGGWARPWDTTVVRTLDDAWSWARQVQQEVGR
ncbi:NUDIX hydrolase [Pseudonocardia sp. CA-107938]|uniref:NUDIX hydrolase n=1 Tax=Pseudonocardia sp. CA-107938 TaxID=3240021 RepID=UPI003D8F5326